MNPPRSSADRCTAVSSFGCRVALAHHPGITRSKVKTSVAASRALLAGIRAISRNGCRGGAGQSCGVQPAAGPTGLVALLKEQAKSRVPGWRRSSEAG
jgi:hypothetical protein